MSVVMAPNGLGAWGLGIERKALTLVVLAAVLRDIDFAWGGHSRETHSLGAAILAGAAVLTWTRGRTTRIISEWPSATTSSRAPSRIDSTLAGSPTG